MPVIRVEKAAGQAFNGLDNDNGLLAAAQNAGVDQRLQVQVNSVAFRSTAAETVLLERVSPEGDAVTLISTSLSDLYVQNLLLPTSGEGVYYRMRFTTGALLGDAVLTYDYDVVGTEQ